MELTLNERDFVNGRFVVAYGQNMEAMFIIVDEEFQGMNNIGRVSKIAILVRRLSSAGQVIASSLQSSVIGLGNQIVGVMSADRQLRGKIMDRHNMSRCVVLLYEQEGA